MKKLFYSLSKPIRWIVAIPAIIPFLVITGLLVCLSKTGDWSDSMLIKIGI
jgi:hypothetical protein